MNGCFLDLSGAIHVSPSKFKIKKPRSFEDQKFDYVFHDIPYDKDVITKDEIRYEISHILSKGKPISSDEAEKRSEKFFQQYGINFDQIVVGRRVAQYLLRLASGEDGIEVPSGIRDFSKNPLRIEELNECDVDSDGEKFYFELTERSKRKENSSEEEDFPPKRQRRQKTTLRKEYRRTDKNRSPVSDILNKNFISNNNLEKINIFSSSKYKNNPTFALPQKPVRLPSDRAPPTRNTLSVISRRTEPVATMMTDFPDEHPYHHVTNDDSAPYCNVASLFNMGNTCFLNSVLYTLRLTPTFLHNLHHLLVDLSLVSTKLKENKTKTSSLGRNGSAVSGSSWRSASSKDLLSIGNDVIPKSKEQIVTEKLHALFMTMNNLESKDSPDPYQPEALLQAIRDANPLFEGNHQQDAHEFFVELLSCLRVTCDKLNEQIEQNPDLIKPPEPTSATANNNGSKIWGVRRSWKKSLKKKDKGGGKKNEEQENEVTHADSEDNLSTDESGDANKKKFGYNFIAEDFQGVSLHRTKCLECEEVSELKEPFLEIQVPVNYREDDFDHDLTDCSIFASVCVTSEKLCDQNKYFCENCNRYNEALRTVLYEKLPNIMVLHLKRFTTSSSGVQKVNTYVPTPLEIRCFCESCNKMERLKTTPHRYRLSCVIMHLGASMASGHYIAYSRASFQRDDYTECSRDIPKNYLNSNGKEISASLLKFFKAKALGNTLSETQNGLGPNSKKNSSQICQSINCCGIRSKLNLGSPNHSNDWLEFDDEKVKTLSNKEFSDLLNTRQESTNTPYLLFYSKM